MNETTTIKLRLDRDNPPQLTDEQIAMLDAVAAMPDSEIDCSDIPQQDFSGESVKKTATIRVDPDVFAWIRTFGESSHSRINAILRNEMRATRRAKA